MSSPNSIKLYNNGINSVLIDSSCNVTCGSKFTFKGELVNQYWKFTNDSDYCRLNGVGGGYLILQLKIYIVLET